MRVLVTGATGFVGPHVVARLLARGHRPVALVRPGRPVAGLAPGVEIAEGDLSRPETLRRACTGVEAVVHVAARQGYWARNNAVQWETNVVGTTNLLAAARAAGVRRFVHVSSIATIGCTRVPAVLDENGPGNMGEVGIHYVDSKIEAERRVLQAGRQGLDVVVLCPAGIAGPRLDGRVRESIFTRVARGTSRWVARGGASITDVEDVAFGIVAGLERGRPGERYVLGGHNLTWHAFYDRIVAATAGPSGRRFREIPAWAGPVCLALTTVADKLHLSRPHRAPELCRMWGWYVWLDSRKAERELGYTVRPFQEILRRSLPGVAPAAAPGAAPPPREERA